MNATQLARSAQSHSRIPEGLSAEARCLWLARAGRWHDAHDQCQDLPDPAGAWIHAWLHREEGDYSNACYWYARASKPAPAQDTDLTTEWMEIANALLDD